MYLEYCLYIFCGFILGMGEVYIFEIFIPKYICFIKNRLKNGLIWVMLNYAARFALIPIQFFIFWILPLSLNTIEKSRNSFRLYALFFIIGFLLRFPFFIKKTKKYPELYRFPN